MIKHQRESIEHSQGGALASRRFHSTSQKADALLAVNRIDRAVRNYKQMKLNAIVMPVKQKGVTNTDLLAEKGRAR